MRVDPGTLLAVARLIVGAMIIVAIILIHDYYAGQTKRGPWR